MNKEEFIKIIEKEGDTHTFYKHYLKCVCMRHPDFLTWNGYIHIHKGHPAYNDDLNIYAHGGITFEQRDEEEYVLGFDTSHYGDLSPYYILNDLNIIIDDDQTYKDLDYVISECESMANQIDEKYPEYAERVRKAFEKMNN
jgi:hypothetical protein